MEEDHMKKDDKIYGATAWPSDVVAEPDTPREKVSRAAMKAQTAGNIPLPSHVAGELVDLLQSKEYPSVIHEPEAHQVYRGMAVPRSYLARALQRGDFEAEGELAANFTFEPTKGSTTSWTLSLQVARNFANDVATAHENMAMWCLVMEAKVDDNPGSLIVGPGGFYKVPQFAAYDTEEEVLAIGPVRVTRVMWWSLFSLIFPVKFTCEELLP
jgi:hypothetical protein